MEERRRVEELVREGLGVLLGSIDLSETRDKFEFVRSLVDEAKQLTKSMISQNQCWLVGTGKTREMWPDDDFLLLRDFQGGTDEAVKYFEEEIFSRDYCISNFPLTLWKGTLLMEFVEYKLFQETTDQFNPVIKELPGLYLLVGNTFQDLFHNPITFYLEEQKLVYEWI